jgi:hypothetical protein
LQHIDINGSIIEIGAEIIIDPATIKSNAGGLLTHAGMKNHQTLVSYYGDDERMYRNIRSGAIYKWVDIRDRNPQLIKKVEVVV